MDTLIICFVVVGCTVTNIILCWMFATKAGYRRNAEFLNKLNWPSHTGGSETPGRPKFDRHGRQWCEKCEGYFKAGTCPCLNK